MDGSVIVCRDAAQERAAVAAERRVAVQPDGTSGHDAIELQRSGPDIGRSGIGLGDSWQHQLAVALLHKPHVASEGAAGQGVGVVLVVDFRVGRGRAVRTLHP